MEGKNAMEWTARKLLELNQDAWKAWAVQAAVNLGVFTAIDRLGGGATVESVAEGVKADRRGLDMLAAALAALGLVLRDGDALSLTGFSRRHLSEDGPGYFGHLFSHMAQIAPDWLRLAECVRHGANAASLPPAAAGGPDAGWHRHFLLGMYNVAAIHAGNVAGSLDLSGAESLLDLGGGPGIYAALFCKENPGLRAVVFDRPESGPVAREITGRLGVSGRVTFEGGDFLSSGLPGGFDFVWLSQVLHGEGPGDAARLVERAFGAAKPGGRVAVQEFVLDDDRRGPLGAALFALNMLVQTPAGASYTYSEIEGMLKGAGAARVEEPGLELPPSVRILIGYKG
jgi:SAM-dependent methyltransferase